MQIDIPDELYARIVDLTKRYTWGDDGDFEAREIWSGEFSTTDDQNSACYSCYEAGMDDGQVLLARDIVAAVK
jgi:hypothetical protein